MNIYWPYFFFLRAANMSGRTPGWGSDGQVMASLAAATKLIDFLPSLVTFEVFQVYNYHISFLLALLLSLMKTNKWKLMIRKMIEIVRYNHVSFFLNSFKDSMHRCELLLVYTSLLYDITRRYLKAEYSYDNQALATIPRNCRGHSRLTDDHSTADDTSGIKNDTGRQTAISEAYWQTLRAACGAGERLTIAGDNPWLRIRQYSEKPDDNWEW